MTREDRGLFSEPIIPNRVPHPVDDWARERHATAWCAFCNAPRLVTAPRKAGGIPHCGACNRPFNPKAATR